MAAGLLWHLKGIFQGARPISCIGKVFDSAQADLPAHGFDEFP